MSFPVFKQREETDLDNAVHDFLIHLQAAGRSPSIMLKWDSSIFRTLHRIGEAPRTTSLSGIYSPS